MIGYTGAWAFVAVRVGGFDGPKGEPFCAKSSLPTAADRGENLAAGAIVAGVPASQRSFVASIGDVDGETPVSGLVVHHAIEERVVGNRHVHGVRDITECLADVTHAAAKPEALERAVLQLVVEPQRGRVLRRYRYALADFGGVAALRGLERG